jgi:hypothetical protein
MNAMLAGEAPDLALLFNFNRWTAFEAPADPLRVSFQEHWPQASFGQVDGRHQPGYPTPDDDN